MNDLELVLPSEALIDLLNQKRTKARLGTRGADVAVINSGFIETKNNTVLTSAAALDKALKDRATLKAVDIGNARCQLAITRRQ